MAVVNPPAPRPVGNLKPGPFTLTEGVVRGLLQGSPSNGTVMVPICADRLSDQCPSSRYFLTDPRNNRANDV